MSDRGVAITRICYLIVDIRCSCYSIRATWNTYFKSRDAFIPAYGSEISHRARQGIRVIEMTSEMRFIGTEIGLTSQGGSMLLDFKSIYDDAVNFMGEAEDVFINPDVGYGTTK